MKKIITIPSLILISLLCGFISGCSETQDNQAQTQLAPMVKVLTVSSPEGSAPRRFPGRVKANREVDLAFQVSGQVVELAFSVGDPVKQGQLLASLDPRDYKNQLDMEVAELNKSKLQYERTLKLVKRGTISQADHDKNTAAYEVAKARVATAKKALEDTQLRAPFSGRVARRFVDNFQNVQAKEPVISLQDISFIDIEFNVPESDFIHAKEAPDARTKARHKVIIDALPNRVFPVVLKSFRTQAEKDTQTFQITVTMQAPQDVSILPGMSATFLYLGPQDNKKQHIYVPIHCIRVDEAGNHFAWLINQTDLTLSKAVVSVGQAKADSVEVLEGLEPGAQIVAAGFDKLSEGQVVRIWQNKGN